MYKCDLYTEQQRDTHSTNKSYIKNDILEAILSTIVLHMITAYRKCIQEVHRILNVYKQTNKKPLLSPISPARFCLYIQCTPQRAYKHRPCVCESDEYHWSKGALHLQTECFKATLVITFEMMRIWTILIHFSSNDFHLIFLFQFKSL